MPAKKQRYSAFHPQYQHQLELMLTKIVDTADQFNHRGTIAHITYDVLNEARTLLGLEIIQPCICPDTYHFAQHDDECPKNNGKKLN